VNRSPLHDVHVWFGAKLVEFAGWEMPLRYRGIIEEHLHTRRACSLFDVSHMGRLSVHGPDAEALLQWTCTRNLSGMADGQCRYGHVCREDGGILDDVIVTRYGPQEWLVVCNASNRDKIRTWLTDHGRGRSVEIVDQTLETAMIALQGPRTQVLVRSLAPIDLSGLRRYHCVTGNVMGMRYTIFRTGYTGEDGYEAVVPAGAVEMLVPPLLGMPAEPSKEIQPAGLGARDTLRLEAAMPLYGHELSEEIDSLSAGQGWCVDLTKDFIGADAMRRLKDRGPAVQLVGLEVEGRRIARQHAALYLDDTRVGEVTSGTMSPTLSKSIAMGLVSSQAAAEGTRLEVDLGTARAPARVVKLPFYTRPKASAAS